MPAKKGTKRPDVAKRNKAAAKAGTLAVKNSDIPLIEMTTKVAEENLINTLAQEAGFSPGLIWTRKQFVELIRKSLDLVKFGKAIEASINRLQIADNATVSLGVVKTALEYSVPKAPTEEQDTAGMPPIVIVQPSVE